MTREKIQKNKTLLQAFADYHTRYLHNGAKINLSKFLPEILYRTMRLEGEQITRKEATAFFQ
jgi:hypothetical protein